MPGNADACVPTCGDGFRVSTEQCDIGNGLKAPISGPGCVGCMITGGWTCGFMAGTAYTSS
jgi:cysteine-rich repeat protein